MNVATHWRLLAPRYRLAGRQCPSCQALLFPPRAACPQCGARLTEPEAAGAASELLPQDGWPRLQRSGDGGVVVEAAPGAARRG